MADCSHPCDLTHLFLLSSSDDRSAEIFKTKIESATQMKAVLGADPRPNCLVIDEIDGAPQVSNSLHCPSASPNILKERKTKHWIYREPTKLENNILDFYTPVLKKKLLYYGMALSVHLSVHPSTCKHSCKFHNSVTVQDVFMQFKRNMYYSPATIIRSAKIWNIILLLAFLRTLSSNLDLEYPAVSEENCLKNLLPLP